jgi:hypothetical protein
MMSGERMTQHAEPLMVLGALKTSHCEPRIPFDEMKTQDPVHLMMFGVQKMRDGELRTKFGAWKPLACTPLGHPQAEDLSNVLKGCLQKPGMPCGSHGDGTGLLGPWEVDLDWRRTSHGSGERLLQALESWPPVPDWHCTSH